MTVRANEKEPDAENLAYQLITANQNTDFPSLWLACQLIGLDLNSPVVALAIAPEESLSNSQFEKLTEYIKKFFEPTNYISRQKGYLTTKVSADTITVFKNIYPQMEFIQEDNQFQQGLKKDLLEIALSLQNHILKTLKHKIFIGIGRCYEGELGPKQSFQEALLALRLGDQLEQEKSIYHVADYPILFLLNHPSKEQMFNIYREIIRVFRKNKELKESLKAFFESNLNISEAAKKLYIHRNTLLYRLNKIEESTSLNPKKFTDAVQLCFALQLLRLERIGNEEKTKID